MGRVGAGFQVNSVITDVETEAQVGEDIPQGHTEDIWHDPDLMSVFPPHLTASRCSSDVGVSKAPLDLGWRWPRTKNIRWPGVGGGIGRVCFIHTWASSTLHTEQEEE